MVAIFEIEPPTIREVLKKLKSPLIVGVAGDLNSGKTTFSNGIRRSIGSDLVSTICTDRYCTEDCERSPLDPEGFHLDVLAQHLADLKRGRTIEVPTYSYGTGQFDSPEIFPPTPIVVVEGPHALYPQFRPFLDFGFYVEPDRAVKWDWTWGRDVKKYGYKVEALEEEMSRREAAVARWIDPQKRDANLVIQVGYSQLENLVPNQFAETQFPWGYRVKLILEPTPTPLPKLFLPFDLEPMLEFDKPPFLLAAVPFLYCGRAAIAVHIDGDIAPQIIAELKDYIVHCTGIPIQDTIPKKPYERASATHFAQLLIAWRFMAKVFQKTLGI